MKHSIKTFVTAAAFVAAGTAQMAGAADFGAIQLQNNSPYFMDYDPERWLELQ